jgi:hypothetical protein
MEGTSSASTARRWSVGSSNSRLGRAHTRLTATRPIVCRPAPRPAVMLVHPSGVVQRRSADDSLHCVGRGLGMGYWRAKLAIVIRTHAHRCVQEVTSGSRETVDNHLLSIGAEFARITHGRARWSRSLGHRAARQELSPWSTCEASLTNPSNDRGATVGLPVAASALFGLARR